jgi:putative redox protein
MSSHAKADTPALDATSRSIAGTLQQDVEVSRRFHVRTDEPQSIGGSDSAPSPHELLPAALASCVGTQIVMYARNHGWDVGHVTVDVRYEHRATPRHFAVTVELGAAVSPAQLSRLDKVARGCPVRRALEGGATFTDRVRAAEALAS